MRARTQTRSAYAYMRMRAGASLLARGLRQRAALPHARRGGAVDAICAVPRHRPARLRRDPAAGVLIDSILRAG